MPSKNSIRAAKQRAEHAFTATRWSMVAGLHLGESERQHCMAELCRLYHYPVYVHIRRKGYSEKEASAFTRAFLGKVLANLDRIRPRGRFRTFLLSKLEEFLANPTAPTQDDLALDVPSDPALSSRYEIQKNIANEEDFDVHFAREVLTNGLQTLRREAAHNGRLKMYEELVGFLTREPTTQEYLRMSKNLDLSKLSLVVALKLLRARFNELVNTELSETVDNPEDLDAERAILHQVLRSESS